MASALRLRDLFVGAFDLGAVDRGGLLTVLRLSLPRFLPRFDSIHADMAAEPAFVSSGITMPFSCAILSANKICAGLADFGPGSPDFASPAFLGACLSRNVRQIDPDFW